MLVQRDLRNGFNVDLQMGSHRPRVIPLRTPAPQPSTSPQLALRSTPACHPDKPSFPRSVGRDALQALAFPHTHAARNSIRTCLLLPYVTCPLLPRAPAPSDPRQHILPSALLTTAVCPLPVSAPSTTQHTPNLPSPACRFERRQPTFPRLCLQATDR